MTSDRVDIHLCLIRLEFFFPEAHSLKEKRFNLRRLKDRLKAKFNVSIAEVGYQDLWQRSVVALAAVSGDRGLLQRMEARIRQEVDELAPSELTEFHVEYF